MNWWESAPVADAAAPAQPGNWWESAPVAEQPQAATPQYRAAETAAMSGFQGVTAGLSDEGSALLAAPALKAMDYFRPDGDKLFKDRSLADLYREARDRYRTANKDSAAQNPKTALVADIGGAIVSPLNKLGGTGMQIGAIQGGANAFGRSEADDPLSLALQTAGGAAGGAALGFVFDKVAGKLMPILRDETSGLAVTAAQRESLKAAQRQAAPAAVVGGMTAEQQAAKQLADSYGVRLSSGDITQDVAQQRAEEMALRGALGQETQGTAQAFRSGQQGDLRNMVSATAQKLGGTPQAVNEADVATALTGKLSSMKAADESVVNQAYKIAREQGSAQLPVQALAPIRQTVDEIRSQFPVTSGNMAGTKAIIDDVEKFFANNPAEGRVNYKVLDDFRVKINNAMDGATRQDQKALRQLKGRMQTMVDDAIEQNLVVGNEQAILKLREATGLAKDYFTRWDKNKAVKQIMDADLAPEQVVQKLVGYGKLGANKQAGVTVGYLKELLGDTSPEWQQLKAAGFWRLVGNDLQGVAEGTATAKGISGASVVKNIDDFLKTNKTLAQTLFTPDELKVIRENALVAQRATARQPGATNPSGTSYAVIDFVNRTLNRLGPLGQFAGSMVNKVPEATRKFADRQFVGQSFEGKVMQPAQGSVSKAIRDRLMSGKVGDAKTFKALLADETGSVPVVPGTKLKLPTDEGSRMARAREMGFDTEKTWYHGTNNDIRAFDITRAGTGAGLDDEKAVFLTSSPTEASKFADVVSVRPAQAGEAPMEVQRTGLSSKYDMPVVYDGSNVMPLHTRTQNPLVVNMTGYNPGKVREALASALRGGNDAVLFRGLNEFGDPSDQLAVLNPATIRSKFAAFDPAKKDSADLLASLGLTAALGGTALTADETPKRKKKGKK